MPIDNTTARQLFDQGQTANQIASTLNAPLPDVRALVRLWKSETRDTAMSPTTAAPPITLKTYIISKRPHLRLTLGADDDDWKMLKTQIDSPIGRQLVPLVDADERLHKIRAAYRNAKREVRAIEQLADARTQEAS